MDRRFFFFRPLVRYHHCQRLSRIFISGQGFSMVTGGDKQKQPPETSKNNNNKKLCQTYMYIYSRHLVVFILNNLLYRKTSYTSHFYFILVYYYNPERKSLHCHFFPQHFFLTIE